MAVTVVLDHPRQHLALRMWRRIGALSGGIVLTVGLLASVVAFPTTLLVASFVIGWLSEQEGEVDPWPSEDVPVPRNPAGLGGLVADRDRGAETRSPAFA